MKLNELRIGSKVYYNGTHKEEGTVTGVTEYLDGSCLVNLNGRANGLYKIEELSPIPITEEILLKCGFFKEEDRSYRWYLGEYFTYDLDDGGFKYEGAWIRPLIKYLHELQNLYFALTQTELEFKNLKNE